VGPTGSARAPERAEIARKRQAARSAGDNLCDTMIPWEIANKGGVGTGTAFAYESCRIVAIRSDPVSEVCRRNDFVLAFLQRMNLEPRRSQAGKSSLYLWGNVDRPPPNRATLRDRQPVYYRWLGDLFGVQKSV
jgi:hypothetical protein